jgi:hypothetical protein
MSTVRTNKINNIKMRHSLTTVDAFNNYFIASAEDFFSTGGNNNDSLQYL